MAVSFPLSLSAFLQSLNVQSSTFDLSGNVRTSRAAGGTVFRSSIGVRLWRGSLSMTGNYHEVQDAAKALVSLARRPDASFLVTDTTRPGPKYDRDGSILGAAAVTVGSVNANRQDITFSGLPVGYELAVGDLVQITYTSGRIYLGEVVVGGDAGSATLEPHIPVGVSAGNVVTLHNPACLAIYDDGSYQPPVRSAVRDGEFSFSWVQKIE